MTKSKTQENKLLKNVELASKLVLKEDKKLFEELGKNSKCNHNVYPQNCAICNTKKDKQILHKTPNKSIEETPHKKQNYSESSFEDEILKSWWEVTEFNLGDIKEIIKRARQKERQQMNSSGKKTWR